MDFVGSHTILIYCFYFFKISRHNTLIYLSIYCLIEIALSTKNTNFNMSASATITMYYRDPEYAEDIHSKCGAVIS
jgi:hypothetical protein